MEVVHLTKRYDPTVAVDDLSFVIPSRTISGFLGPNGAGKTTTFRWARQRLLASVIDDKVVAVVVPKRRAPKATP